MVPAKVSIVVTCYNGARWIRRAVESAFAQTYQDREIIAVDDGSSDGSFGLLDSFRDRPGFHLVAHTTNRGIPGSKNSGLRHARGEYVAFLEQDDSWLPQKLEWQVRALQADPEAGLVFAAAIREETSGRQSVRRTAADFAGLSRQAAVETLFRGNSLLSMSGVMVRRSCLEALGGFDERYAGADDWDLYLRLAGRHPIVYLDRPLFRLQVHDTSFTQKHADRMLADKLAIVEEAVARYPFLAPLRRRRRAELLRSFAMVMFVQGESSRAREYALRAWREDWRLPAVYPSMALVLSAGLGRSMIRLWRRTGRWRRFPAGAAAQRERPPGSRC